MAGNKTSPSQAEQSAKVNKSRKESIASSKTQAATSRKTPPTVTKKPAVVSPQILMGLINATLFLLMCGMAFSKEGKVLEVLRNFLFGMVGRGAFYVAVFAPLFLAVSFLHRAKKNVNFRTRCAVIFILAFGVLHHLLVSDLTIAYYGEEPINEFYTLGIAGGSGGLFCGLVGYVLRWALGKTFSVIIVSLILLLALFGAVGITVPGIMEAIRNLPSGDSGSDDGDDSEPETSARFVEDVINTWSGWDRKRKERARRREEKQSRRWAEAEEKVFGKNSDYDEDWEDDEAWEDDEDEVEIPNIFSRRKEKASAEYEPKHDHEKRQKSQATRDFMDEVERDVTGPAGTRANAPFFEEEPESEPVVKADPAVRKVTANEAAASAQEVTMEIEKNKAAPKVEYKYPPIDLLRTPGRSAADGAAEMKHNIARLNETLASFKIEAHICNATRGPSVTRYEVELEKGVRLNKLTTVADDIALSLGVSSVRIAPVPQKISIVGIEVPNRVVTNVSLREVVDSREFSHSRSKSTFAVGKDIGGTCIVGNIAKMPHMLIAGTTGSGKSVCMNSIIISLLYKASPDEVKLIMVDPKMVELGIYNDIPHLLIPVVTDPKKAAGSLQWAVTEMMRRYKLMSDAGVRDLESFNSIVESEQEGEKLPQVVIIIDELADLMLVAAKEVEDSICRIAQMGRAAGMHLIIATQRPSSDVITGLMKANIPSRIAFSVASAMESRIILDTQGAEKLVGKGDMLFAPIGTGKPQRIQGCFVTDGEVEAVANFVKNNYKASYDKNVIDEIEKTTLQTGKKSAGSEPDANDDELAGDEMLPQAVEVILDTKQASVSMLQRRLKLGYARAARIVDEMEEKGIVGPSQGSKPRDILITREQWEELKRKLYPGLCADAPEEPVDLPF